jgi:16S rRNA C967 or C1407 C5-methylase (RsmB/RsmF family)
MSKSLKGPTGFTSFYTEQIGQRWSSLRQACLLPNRPMALTQGLSQPYYLDEASVLAARWLAVQPGQQVLDLCAAPGGKTLAIAQDLFALHQTTVIEPLGRLVANERSADRRGRLKRVLANHLPIPFQTAVTVTGHDASRWGQYETAIYDRILLDVPCSSERHLLQNPRHLETWSASRSSRLAQQAYALCLSAAQALKPAGLIVYCTCALSRLENDGVIERVLERLNQQAARHGWNLTLAPPAPTATPALWPEWAEPTAFGLQIWPDRAEGRGPLYLSRLEKLV